MLEGQNVVREGHCIDCGAKIGVVNGVRDRCDCPAPKKPPTKQEKEFADWFERMARITPKPRL